MDLSIKRITVNLPSELLEEAMKISGENMTETLKMGLEMIKRRKAAAIAEELAGTIDLNLDIDALRGR